MRGVFLDLATVSEGHDLDLALLHAAIPDLEVCADARADELPRLLEGRSVAVTNRVEFTRAVIAASPALKLIALTATGSNNVDLVAAREHGVAVCNIRDYCTRSVVQHVFAVLLALTHGLREYDRALKSGAWESAAAAWLPNHSIRELDGLTLGIVGYGALGRGVADIARAFGMKVLIANRPGGAAEPGRVDLDSLLPVVDVLTLHCPSTPTTRGLIGARELSLMKRDAVLINAARGGLVDAVALARVLREGRLGGAAVDVLVEEPPLKGNPLLAPDLVNLIATPHVAWAARESRQRAIDETAANVRDFAAGGRRSRIE